MADLITNLYTVIAPTFLMTVILSPFIFNKYLFSKKKDNNICGDYIDSGDFSDFSDYDDESNADKIRTTITFPDEKEYDGLLHITFISKDFIDLKRKIKKIKFQFKKLH